MRVVWGLGSNLGDRLAHLQAAVDRLTAAGPTVVSPVFETDPVGGPEQEDYLNAVAVSTLPAGGDPLLVAQAVEQARGRERRERWGPRTLDVDVLDVDGRRSDEPRLVLPHPRAHLRAFVLVPWLAVDPAAEVAGRGSVADLLAALSGEDRRGVRPRPDLVLASG